MTFIVLLLGLATATAQETQHQDAEESPYGPVRQDPRVEAQHDPYSPRRHSETTHQRNPTGLRIQSGTSLALTFGHDHYQDGATLAAIVQGLEVGERLVIERTETGVLLRRHGGSPSRAYDFLESDPRSGREEP
ncbi:MAG: hypothetical protein LC637_01580 [Xanthomonadaceae bacterium]|nr:hypothetical protein [Xanthomonadaceae bacterium]